VHDVTVFVFAFGADVGLEFLLPVGLCLSA
jgi:hypothetical protein